MISGDSATGHEIDGTLGIAIYASIAKAASGGAFVGPPDRLAAAKARAPHEAARSSCASSRGGFGRRSGGPQ